MSTPAARTVKPRPPEAPDVAVLVKELEGWFVEMKRNLAAFSSLNESLQSHQGGLPEGERKKGLPVFEFPAPGADGRESIRCVIDLKNIDPRYVPHVLVPMINATAGDLLEAVQEVHVRAETLMPVLQAMVGPQPEDAAA